MAGSPRFWRLVAVITILLLASTPRSYSLSRETVTFLLMVADDDTSSAVVSAVDKTLEQVNHYLPNHRLEYIVSKNQVKLQGCFM